MFTTTKRTPAIVAVAILAATTACLSLGGCAPRYNHEIRITNGLIKHQRMLNPSIVTKVAHVR
jgi:hypothetical protein